MWSRMLVMMVGRVTIGTFTAAMLAVLLAAVWLFMIEPNLDLMVSATVSAGDWLGERWYWFKDWFLRGL